MLKTQDLYSFIYIKIISKFISVFLGHLLVVQYIFLKIYMRLQRLNAYYTYSHEQHYVWNTSQVIAGHQTNKFSCALINPFLK